MTPGYRSSCCSNSDRMIHPVRRSATNWVRSRTKCGRSRTKCAGSAINWVRSAINWVRSAINWGRSRTKCAGSATNWVRSTTNYGRSTTNYGRSAINWGRSAINWGRSAINQARYFDLAFSLASWFACATGSKVRLGFHFLAVVKPSIASVSLPLRAWVSLWRMRLGRAAWVVAGVWHFCSCIKV